MDEEILKEWSEEWRQIEMLAIALLSGFIEGLDEGRPRQKYFEGEEENRAREAIARLLRSGFPLTQDFRDRLAALFDPNDQTHPSIDRELTFRRRSSGRPRDHVRNTAIAQHVVNCMREGDRVEAAQQKAAKNFNLSREAVRDIWGHKESEGFRRLMPLISGSSEVEK